MFPGTVVHLQVGDQATTLGFQISSYYIGGDGKDRTPVLSLRLGQDLGEEEVETFKELKLT